MKLTRGNISIEHSQRRDIEEVRAIAMANNYFNPDYQDYRKAGFTGTVYAEETLQKIIENGNSFSAKDHSKTIGYFLGINAGGYRDAFEHSLEDLSESFFENRTSIPQNVIYSPQTAVDPAYKRKGVVSELFEEVKRHYVNSGFKAIYAEIVNSNSGSISVWTKKGFKILGTRKPKDPVFIKKADYSLIEQGYKNLLEKRDNRVNPNILSQLLLHLYFYDLEGK